MRIERRCERRASRISCSRGQIPRKLGCCCRQASVSAAWLPLHTATLTWFDIVHINPSPLLQHTALQMSTALTVMECNDKCERNKQRSRLTTSAVEPSTSTPAPQHYSTPSIVCVEVGLEKPDPALVFDSEVFAVDHSPYLRTARWIDLSHWGAIAAVGRTVPRPES
jgi:hypothetical protein